MNNQDGVSQKNKTRFFSKPKRKKKERRKTIIFWQFYIVVTLPKRLVPVLPFPRKLKKYDLGPISRVFYSKNPKIGIWSKYVLLNFQQ